MSSELAGGQFHDTIGDGGVVVVDPSTYTIYDPYGLKVQTIIVKETEYPAHHLQPPRCSHI